MIQKVQEKRMAIELRKQGLSYREILKRVDVAKSSLSGWLKHLDLTSEQLKNLEEKVKNGQDQGRIKSSLANRQKRFEREAKVFEVAKVDFEKNNGDNFFMLGIALYWAEGSKRTTNFQFINSDPDIIRLMIRWCEKYMNVTKEGLKIRLFMHEIYANENCEDFWAVVTGIPKVKFQKTIFKPTRLSFKKNPNYKGCLRITINRVESLRRVLAWKNLLVGYYG